MTASRTAAAIAGVLTVLLLQATLIGPLTFPVPVSLPALVVVVVGIYAGPGIGLGLGFATGLLADLGSDHPAGVLALGWMLGGLFAGIVGGLATERGCRTRAVALLAAGLATLVSLGVGLLFAMLGSHAASAASTVRYLIPIALVDAVLGLVVVPPVRMLLRNQGIRTPRSTATVSRTVSVKPMAGGYAPR
jgi:rod shape-determining protein MreD